MTDTIAAGEIREYEAYGGKHVLIKPFCRRGWLENLVYASVHPHHPTTITADSMIGELTPAEARDFARAILAAADWAERQGRGCSK